MTQWTTSFDVVRQGRDTHVCLHTGLCIHLNLYLSDCEAPKRGKVIGAHT